MMICARLPLACLSLCLCAAPPADAQGAAKAPLRELLERVGRSVELFREQFPAVVCTEKVSQTRLGNKGNVLQHQESLFDYLIFFKQRGRDLRIEESRVQKSKAQKAGSKPLLVTSGFATLLLIFDPVYQDCYEFSQVSEESWEGRRVLNLRFQHVNGTRSTAALRIGTRDEPLDLKGNAWIDPESAAVVRVAAELSVPLAERGLRTFAADVHYSPIRFESAPEVFWLPSSAVIEVGARLQHWRNTHLFADYRRFSVTSESVIKK